MIAITGFHYSHEDHNTVFPVRPLKCHNVELPKNGLFFDARLNFSTIYVGINLGMLYTAGKEILCRL